jgi:hypothetical protein
MAQEVRAHTQGAGAGARAQEWREPEPAADDQPEATLAPREPWTGAGTPDIDPHDHELRSRIGRYLDRSVFPGDAGALIANARSNKATDEVLALLDRLPSGFEFETVAHVWAVLGGENERRR